jgi:DNA-binding NarL/FixJ family response regulator
MPTFPITTIYIVDDHESVITGLKFVLEQNDAFKVIGGNTSAELAIEEIYTKRPNYAIIDYNLNGNSTGIDLINSIKAMKIPTKSILLSFRSDDELIYSAKKAGARGYISKNSSNKELKTKIEEIINLNKLHFKELDPNYTIPNKVTPEVLLESFAFTPREISVIHLVLEGLSNKEIAKKLDKSYFSITSIRSDINSKIRKKNFVNFIHFASYAKSNNLFRL